jgi:succinoglycan biosynthesis transport protein ExoP
MGEQQLAELNTQLGIAREKTAEARARLDRIETIIDTDGANKDHLGGTVSDTLNNPVIVKLRSEYLEFANRKSDFLRRLGKEHLAVINLERQMRGIRESISDELRRIAETYKSEYEISRQRQSNIEKAVADAVARMQEASQALIELRQLESSAEAYRGMHKSAVQRNTELVQQQSFPGSEARLITRASPPTEKSGPKTAIILVVTASAGMIIGLGLGVLRVTLENVFRTSGQVESVLQAHCIALVPMIDPGKPSARVQASEARTVRQWTGRCHASRRRCAQSSRPPT